MVKNPPPTNSQSSTRSITDEATPPAMVTALKAIEGILSDPAISISRANALPSSISEQDLSHVREEELKIVSAMFLTAATAWETSVSTAACWQIQKTSKVLGPVAYSVASEAGAYDAESVGIDAMAGYYPELIEWRLTEILRNPSANDALSCLALNGLLGINPAKAKEFAQSLQGDYLGSSGIQSLCEVALNLKDSPNPSPEISKESSWQQPPIRLTAEEQADVKRLFALGQKAIFDTDTATALAAMDQLAKEPPIYAVPLLVAATRFENEKCQRTAREHLKRLAPDIASLLPDKFNEYSSRIAHFK